MACAPRPLPSVHFHNKSVLPPLGARASSLVPGEAGASKLPFGCSRRLSWSVWRARPARHSSVHHWAVRAPRSWLLWLDWALGVTRLSSSSDRLLSRVWWHFAGVCELSPFCGVREQAPLPPDPGRREQAPLYEVRASSPTGRSRRLSGSVWRARPALHSSVRPQWREQAPHWVLAAFVEVRVAFAPRSAFVGASLARASSPFHLSSGWREQAPLWVLAAFVVVRVACAPRSAFVGASLARASSTPIRSGDWR